MDFDSPILVLTGFLADQLLQPLALAGGGQFTTTAWSQYAATNVEVISLYPCRFVRSGVIKMRFMLWLFQSDNLTSKVHTNK